MSNGVRVRVPILEQLAVTGQSVLADPGRALTPSEREMLMQIFGASVNLRLIRIAITDLGAQGRPYTLGNTIRIPRGTSFDARTLVHEVAHVWQYQTRGTSYISDSVFHQLTSGADAYNVSIVAGQSIYDYAAEQQAVIIERYYANDPAGWRTNPDVERMMRQVRRAQQLSDEEIQRETWHGPNNPDPFRFNAPGNERDRPAQTVPLIRLEF
jgi:hypothetical protein